MYSAPSPLRATDYALRTKKGFTLIEVLIVVGIIGLLASVVLSGLGSVRSRGRDARRVADLRQVQQGLELYYTRCQFYPGGADCAAGDIQGGSTSWDQLTSALKNSNLGITTVSTDPLCKKNETNCEDNYVYSSDGDEYVLQAALEDKDSPLTKDSYDESFSGTQCGTTSGDRFYYCIKF